MNLKDALEGHRAHPMPNQNPHSPLLVTPPPAMRPKRVAGRTQQWSAKPSYAARWPDRREGTQPSVWRAIIPFFALDGFGKAGV
jgi:hypothetical protein